MSIKNIIRPLSQMNSNEYPGNINKIKSRNKKFCQVPIIMLNHIVNMTFYFYHCDTEISKKGKTSMHKLKLT